MGLDDVRDMQQDVMFSKMKEEQSLVSFISDRTTIDNACYALYWLGQRKEYSDWYQGYYNKAIKHFSNTYDIVFILPWGEIKLENDGIRSSNKWYQFILQQMMENMANKHQGYDAKVHMIMSRDMESRVRDCLYWIDQWKYPTSIEVMGGPK